MKPSERARELANERGVSLPSQQIAILLELLDQQHDEIQQLRGLIHDLDARTYKPRAM